MRTNFALWRILLLLLALFGYLCISNYILANRIQAVYKHPVYTQGVVQGKQVNGRVPYLLVQFTANSQTYNIKMDSVKNAGNLNVYNSTSVGEKVNILYDSQNPSIAYLTSNLPDKNKSKEIALYCGLAFILVLAVEVALILRAQNI